MNLRNLDILIGFALVMLLLSLVVTTVVQVVIALSGLRGKNLLWGVGRLVEQLVPQHKAEAAAVASAILLHPAVAHTDHRPATAIRFDELVGIVGALEAATPAGTQVFAGGALRNLAAELAGAVTTVASAAGTVPAAAPAEVARVLAVGVGAAVDQTAVAVGAAVDRATVAVGAAVERARFWFDAIMDRTTERFVLRTRWITAGTALVLAFALQIDSLSILSQLSDNDQLRARLVAEASPVLEKAREQLAPALPASSPGSAAPPAPASTPEDIKTLTARIDALHAQLQATSLAIVPPGLTACNFIKQFGKRSGIGMLLTAVFLSLGGPFWFNTLSQLANLRPILAGKVEGDETKGGS
jgi:hypothetical protein